MSSSWRAALGEERRADSLESEEDKHADTGCDEEETAAKTINKERGAKCNTQIPNLKDTVDEELGSRVGDANSVEDLVEVVRDQTVTRPLREEGNSNDNPHALAVTRAR